MTTKNKITLKSNHYYWVRYKLHKNEIMQVLTKPNHTDLYFVPIGSKEKFELEDITVIKEVEGV